MLLIPPPPLIKVASNARPCSTLGGTTLNGREGEDSIIYHRPAVTSSDLKEERLFFRWTVSTTFLQLVVAPSATSLLENIMDTLHLTALNTVTFQLPHLNESNFG